MTVHTFYDLVDEVGVIYIGHTIKEATVKRYMVGPSAAGYYRSNVVKDQFVTLSVGLYDRYAGLGKALS